MSTRQLEDDLMIYSWGSWARDRIERELGCKEAPWAHLMDTASGYDESPQNPIPKASDSWCEKIDKMIASMGEQERCILIALYSRRLSVSKTSEAQGVRRHEIRILRDAALNRLHGAMFLQKAG